MIAKPSPTGKMARTVGAFEYSVVLILIALLMLVVVASTIELGLLLFRDLFSPGRILDTEEMLEIFGFFLLVLMGLEVITTLTTYVYRRVLHMKVVLEVALIAVTQKIIILDTVRTDGTKLIGLASLILALAGALALVRKRPR